MELCEEQWVFRVEGEECSDVLEEYLCVFG